MFSGSALLMIVLVAPGGATREAGDPPRDVRQTIAARKLLADDPDLAAWNVGVIVTNRVATLWGPVPSAEIAFRAEVRVRSMIDLADVKNELFVSELVEPMRPLKIDNPPRFLPDTLPRRRPIDPALLETSRERERTEVAPPAKATPAPPIQVLPPEILPAPDIPRRLP